MRQVLFLYVSTMKYLVIVCVLWQFTEGKVLPGYLKPYSCSKSDPDYSKCVLRGFENARPYFVKGIPELNFPPIDPFELPLLTVNQANNDLVRINATCRNIRVIGASNTIIKDIKADPQKQSGEVRLSVPWIHMEMEYDVLGQLLVIPLKSSGYFEGNFTDTEMYIRGSLKKYKKDGEEFFKVNKIHSKITVGDGHIKMIENNPELQFGADMIATFFNENPRRVMDVVNPLFTETSNDMFRIMSDEILSTLPASEWVPA